MTDRELMQQALEALDGLSEPYDVLRIQTALRERLAQPESEPVAWRWKERINSEFDSWVITSSEPPPYAVEKQPLYTTPPQRTWVGLTDDDVDLLQELYAPPVHPDFANDADHCLELIRHVEAKLKEKNT